MTLTKRLERQPQTTGTALQQQAIRSLEHALSVLTYTLQTQTSAIPIIPAQVKDTAESIKSVIEALGWARRWA